MSTEATFLVIVALVALQRLAELRTSAAHEERLRAMGAVEHAAWQVPWMRGLHAAWLFAAPIEVFALERAFDLWVAVPALALFLIGQALRFAAMRALGPRWTVRVLTLPGAPRVTGGVFRLRHPNYLGVALEIAALPMMHGAWISALGFSAANALFLWRRVRVEEAALGEGMESAGDRTHLDRMGVKG